MQQKTGWLILKKYQGSSQLSVLAVFPQGPKSLHQFQCDDLIHPFQLQRKTALTYRHAPVRCQGGHTPDTSDSLLPQTRCFSSCVKLIG